MAKSKTSALQLLMNEARLGEGEEGDPELSELVGGLLDTPLSTDVKEDVDKLGGLLGPQMLSVSGTAETE